MALIVAALGAFALLCNLSRHTRGSLLPAGAFSMRSAVGLGLWMALLLSLANDPFSLYGPLFLQEFHGLSPLSAGYVVALEAMSWTLGSLCVSGVSPLCDAGRSGRGSRGSGVLGRTCTTVQLYGFAFGGAVAGLIANVIGYSRGLSIEATRAAAFWVPASFVSATIAAALLAARLESHRFLKVRATAP